MKFLALLTLLALTSGEVAAENSDASQQEHLLQSLYDLGAGPLSQESEFLKNYVMQDSTDFNARITAFETFLEKHPFTEHHASNLAAHITYGTVDRPRMVRFSSAFATTAIRSYWDHLDKKDITKPTPALLFLERLFINGEETLKTACAEGINDALKATPIKLAPPLDLTHSTPDQYADAMQCCITLGVFKEERSVSDWFDIPPQTAGFLDATGIWLFDNEALPETYRTCLQHIFKNIPRSLHNVAVLFVPDTIPFSAASSPLRLPGIALDIPVVPEDAVRDFSTTPPYVSQPPLPEFMALALEQAMKAIIATTLPKRPDLLQRTAAIMHTAVALPDTPIAKMAPPAIMMGTPDGLLAYLGALWLANAEALLEAAIVVAEQGNPMPLYTILLVADLFSQQGDTTLLFHTTPMGTFTASETALRRMFVTPVVSYVNGIALNGRLWQYDMSGIAAMP